MYDQCCGAGGGAILFEWSRSQNLKTAAALAPPKKSEIQIVYIPTKCLLARLISARLNKFWVKKDTTNNYFYLLGTFNFLVLRF